MVAFGPKPISTFIATRKRSNVFTHVCPSTGGCVSQHALGQARDGMYPIMQASGRHPAGLHPCF